ncbi:MAG: hypothetical protein AAF558_14120, partial [Verrucomicrobiota bacterium]
LRRGYTLRLIHAGNDTKTLRALGRSLSYQGIRGLIFLPTHISLSAFSFPWDRFCSVALENYDLHPFMPSISRDSNYTARFIFEQLQQRGYQKPGFILPEATLQTTESNWPDAILAAYGQFPKFPKIPWLHFHHKNPVPKNLLGILKPWLDQYNPDCLVNIGRGFYMVHLLKRLKRRIPKDIGLAITSVGKHDTPLHISGIAASPPQLSTVILDLLIGRLHRGEFGKQNQPINIRLLSPWVEGRTLRPLNGPKS